VGWTIYYKGSSTDPISEEEKQCLFDHKKRWNSKLHEGCERYSFEIEGNGKILEGLTKVHFSEEDKTDFETILAALQELEKILPNFNFKITDDYYLNNFNEVVPSFVGDPYTFTERFHKRMMEDFDGIFERFQQGKLEKFE